MIEFSQPYWLPCGEKVTMTNKKSKYDTLYDKYSDAPSPKMGTKYERLTAFVIKALEHNSVVVHDIKLLGESGVKHQIDVKMSQDGVEKNILIECKDFDVTKKNVGLGIIRDFRSVVEDTKPAHAFVITCNGFTKPAKKYAKSKGIKLAVLRKFENSDMEGRIQTVNLRFHIFMISDLTSSINVSCETDKKKLQVDLNSIGALEGFTKEHPVYICSGKERIQILEFIEDKANEHPREQEDPVRLKIRNLEIEVEQRGPVPLEELIIEFNVYHDEDFYNLNSSKVAELILCRDYASDIIIFEEDMKRYQIDVKTGEII